MEAEFALSLAGQRAGSNRYQLIPRTLTFVLRGERVLLLELDESKGAWAGHLNGVGGHIERGEHPMRSARRELREETGLRVDELRLCGVVVVDTGESPGIGLYVFVGESPEGEASATGEGAPMWVSLKELGGLPLVQDLPILLPRSLKAYEENRPFSALYQYDDGGELSIEVVPA